MMKCGIQKLFLFSGMIFFGNKISAQNFDELRAKYPNDYALILNYNKDTRIFLENGIPKAETKVSEEIVVLDDKANGEYNRYGVYHGSFNTLKDIEAYTKAPAGNGFNKINVGEMKTQVAASAGVFYDDMKETSFDFPALTKGATAYVNYTEENTDLHLLSPFYCVSYMPVVNEKFTVTFPSDFDVKYIIRNDSLHSIKIKEDKKGKERRYTFTDEDIQPFEGFGNAPAAAYYEPHIITQLVSYKNENKEQVNFLSNLDDLYKWDYGFIKDLDNTNSSQLKYLADSLTAGISSQREKAKIIYQWVQHNIKYVAFEDGMEGFVPRRAADICEHRFGDCKDMASLISAMLQIEGIKAYFTWIGTRDIPYDYTDIALPIDDNHMIAAANIDGDWIFLDGTDPNCIFGFPSGFIQGKQALIAISGNEYKLLRVPEVDGKKNVVVDSTFISVESNGIKGNSSIYYNGYFGSDVKNSLLYKDENDTKDYVKSKMSKASNKFILGNYTINKLNDDEKPVNIKADFEIPGYSAKVADELYINLNLQKFYTSNSIIDTSKRKIPFESDFKYYIKQYTILDVPAGYAVSYLPKDFSVKNDLYDFTIHYSQDQNKVIAMQEISNKVLMMEPKDFTEWNTGIKQLISQYKEQVVLQKK
jgi:hypothetical protein